MYTNVHQGTLSLPNKTSKTTSNVLLYKMFHTRTTQSKKLQKEKLYKSEIKLVGFPSFPFPSPSLPFPPLPFLELKYCSRVLILVELCYV